MISRRSDFDLPAGEIYLDGAYCSPLPRVARQAVDDAYEINAQPYRIGADEFFGYVDAVRERLSRVLAVPEEEIGISTSMGHGAMLINQGLEWQAGERLLIGPDEFPSNVYPWLSARDLGVEVEFIGQPGAPLAVEQLAEALSRPGRVRVVALAAVHYLTGNLHPLEEMSRLVHQHDALMVVDATQAAGCVAIDWQASGIDALLTSGYKWLLAPYGNGASWMRRSLIEELRNVGGNWWANEKARDFRTLLEYAPVPVHGRRMDSGETASFLNLGAWRAGLDYLLDIGVAQVEAHQRALQDRLASALEAVPLRIVTQLDAPHRSPMFYLEPTGEMSGEQLQAEFQKRKIRVSLRGGRLRISPGMWSEESDIDALVQTISSLAAHA